MKWGNILKKIWKWPLLACKQYWERRFIIRNKFTIHTVSLDELQCTSNLPVSVITFHAIWNVSIENFSKVSLLLVKLKTKIRARLRVKYLYLYLSLKSYLLHCATYEKLYDLLFWFPYVKGIHIKIQRNCSVIKSKHWK